MFTQLQPSDRVAWSQLSISISVSRPRIAFRRYDNYAISVLANLIANSQPVKVMLMFYIVFSTIGKPIITMGDAVASFLDDRDATTMNIGPIGIHDCKKYYNAGAATWNDRRWRWKDATSKKRRMVTLVWHISHSQPLIHTLIRCQIRDCSGYCGRSPYMRSKINQLPLTQ